MARGMTRPAGVSAKEETALRAQNKILAGIMAGLMLTQPVSAQPARTAESLAGHYYLSGVMETGSELLLRPDGTFDWGISYGAMDSMASGRWATDGRQVTLTARQPEPNAVKFRLGDRGAWNERVTHSFEHRREQEALEHRAAHCPLPSLSSETVPDLSLTAYGDKMPSAAQIASIEEEAQAAWAAAQTALDRLKGNPAWPRDEALVVATDSAIEAFQSKLAAVQGLHEAARIEGTEPAPLVLPEECRVPDFEAEIRAFQGVAIHVFDPVRYERGDGIRVEARYEDGSTQQDMVTGGYAFFPVGTGHRIISITLAAPGSSPEKKAAFPVDLPAASVQLVDAELGALATPLFDELVLPVRADGALDAAALFRRGAYEKARPSR